MTPNYTQIMGQSNQRHHFYTQPQILDIDINNLIDPSTLSSDEFRMYTYKVKKCPRIRRHDWTSCPLAHDGERAKRRDLHFRYYAAIPCNRFKTGECPNGDLCEFAHGVFEFWLHPAKYRTRKCHAGEFCRRSVCFFAHTEQELRPETMYQWYKINDNPLISGRYTIGYESNGHIVLPFLSYSSHQASSSDITNVDHVTENIAMLNIKLYNGQPRKMIETSSSSTTDYSNSNDLPPDLNWITELVRDT